MADVYRASVRNVLGQAVAMVEVEIKRTFFIDANVWEQVSQSIGSHGTGEGSGGMEELKSFWQTASTLPPEALPYFSMPWTPADAAAIELRPLHEIEQLTSQTTYFRVEGSPRGYTGVLSLAGQETRLDMSLSAMPAFYAFIDENVALVDAQQASGALTQSEANTIKEFCDTMGQSGRRCEETMRKQLDAEKAARREDREIRGREVQTRDFGTLHETHRGDFGRDFGGSHRGTA